MKAERKIIHIDMDAFFASVEQADNPELKGKAIAVGGGENRGVVCAASYEARKFGVKSAMSGKLAQQLCPEIIFVKPRFSRYKEISKQIREIFHEYTDLVEPLSLDEAYLDVTQNKKNLKSATIIAQEIRRKIFEKTSLTASAGISVNKFIAKIASDFNKPNGQTTIAPYQVLDFLKQLEIRKFHGIGKVTAQKMYKLGIFTGEDLYNKSLDFLTENFKNNAQYFYNLARGIHNSPVVCNHISKSVGVENTFDKDIPSEVFMLKELEKITQELEIRLKNKNFKAKTFTLKLKYNDFSSQTRSKTISNYINDQKTIFNLVEALLFQQKIKKSVRLLGVSASNFDFFQKKEEKKQKIIQLEFDF